MALLGRTDLVTVADIEGKTELMLSGKGIAYLCNLSEEEVNAEFKRQSNGAKVSTMRMLRMPKLWRIKAQENIARLGTDDFTEVLELMVAEREGTNR